MARRDIWSTSTFPFTSPFIIGAAGVRNIFWPCYCSMAGKGGGGGETLYHTTLPVYPGLWPRPSGSRSGNLFCETSFQHEMTRDVSVCSVPSSRLTQAQLTLIVIPAARPPTSPDRGSIVVGCFPAAGPLVCQVGTQRVCARLCVRWSVRPGAERARVEITKLGYQLSEPGKLEQPEIRTGEIKTGVLKGQASRLKQQKK